LLFAVLIVGLVQKGFFFTYMRVRLSFGRLIMVKIRSVNRDHFKAGYIADDKFLVYGTKTGNHRISLPDASVFYRCLSVNWIDLTEEGKICKPDYSVVSGFDPEKYDNLYKRTLMRPSANEMQQKFLMALIVGAIIAAGLAAIVAYLNGKRIDGVISALNALKDGLVVPK